MILINIIKTIVTHPLSRKNKALSILNFLRWQMVSRLVQEGEGVINNWVDGSKLIAYTGETGATGNIYLGLHEFPDMGFLLHTLRDKDFFIDIGANIGSYTVLASSAIGAKTVCFEPVPSTYKRLMDNIKINNIENKVESLNLALGNSTGEMYFSSDQNCMNHIIAHNENNSNKITVNVSTLDKELKRDPFLIKIDVEGYELPVLEGAQKILSNSELCGVIMELNGSGERYGHDESKILSMMIDYGFKPYAYDPIIRNLVELNERNKNEGNTIFIRDLERVKKRIKESPLVKIFNTEI